VASSCAIAGRERGLIGHASVPSYTGPVEPVIGIPLCHDAHGRIRSGREYLYTDIAYAQAVARAGGLPVHLPLPGPARALVERIDGLLLPGGDDFLPPEAPADPAVYTPASRDQLDFDAQLLEAALASGRPVLGICYGAQWIGRRFGASFYYHLPDECPQASNHQLDEANGRHPIEVEATSRLAEQIGAGPHEVNSLHHQALRDPGPTLRISARAPDGMIEAVEHPDLDFCVGVQWHPEKLPGPASDALFAAFVAACEEAAPG